MLEFTEIPMPKKDKITKFEKLALTWKIILCFPIFLLGNIENVIVFDAFDYIIQFIGRIDHN